MVALEDSKLFRNLDRTEVTALRQIAQERTYEAGQQIFKQGDNGDGIYAVKNGAVEISVQSSSGRRVLAEVAPGEIFGEMAVLEIKPRSATATAKTRSAIYFVPRDELLAMIARQPALALDLLREISERLRAFNERHVQEILQEERLGLVGRFAQSILHDLKNPLSIIGLAAELASLDKSTPEVRLQSTRRIRTQVDRINEMIRDILDFTRETPAQLVFASMDYGKFVQEVIEQIQPELELRRVRINLAEPPPPLSVTLDPRRFPRVFQNLINNAADVMPHGGTVTLHFRLDGADLITGISDSGPGLAPEIADRLFEPFATFGKAHGTGLGLSICKRIVEDHQGRIWAANHPDGGAVFSFSLPLAGSSYKMGA